MKAIFLYTEGEGTKIYVNENFFLFPLSSWRVRAGVRVERFIPPLTLNLSPKGRGDKL